MVRKIFHYCASIYIALTTAVLARNASLVDLVYQDKTEAALQLIESGEDVNAKNPFGVSPLSLACQNGNETLIKALLKAGADPNTTLRGGETALMTASRTGLLKPVDHLIEKGAKVTATEQNGQTALMWAAAEGHAQVVAKLIACGADPKRTLKSGFFSDALCCSKRSP